MAEHERPDIEPESDRTQQKEPSVKGRISFRQVRRELTEEELSSPAAQRFLLDELDRLDKEVDDLKSIREQFHAADKRADVLEQRLQRHTALEILSSGALLAGALALGYAPRVWDTGATGPMLVALGVILIAAGIWAKAIRV
jgi:hypothetical protein